MKRLSIISLLIIAINISGFSQLVIAKEDCLKHKDAPKVYVAGYKNCIIDGHTIIFRINPEILKKGFELKQIDSSFSIISFRLTFDEGEDLIEMPSTGSKIVPGNDSLLSLSKIAGATLITRDSIWILIGNRKVILPGLALYCDKD